MAYRIASLVGLTKGGDLLQLGVAGDNQLQTLKDKCQAIITAGGVVEHGGKRPVSLSEIHLLANHTSGGYMRMWRFGV
jgi:hypothetical protein